MLLVSFYVEAAAEGLAAAQAAAIAAAQAVAQNVQAAEQAQAAQAAAEAQSEAPAAPAPESQAEGSEPKAEAPKEEAKEEPKAGLAENTEMHTLDAQTCKITRICRTSIQVQRPRESQRCINAHVVLEPLAFFKQSPFQYIMKSQYKRPQTSCQQLPSGFTQFPVGFVLEWGSARFYHAHSASLHDLMLSMLLSACLVQAETKAPAEAPSTLQCRAFWIFLLEQNVRS